MGSSATSVCSVGSGGSITSWEAFDAWARSVEGEEVERQLADGLGAEPDARRSWSALGALVALVGTVVPQLPDFVRGPIYRACASARRVLFAGEDAASTRLAAHRELARPLRDLLARIRAARGLQLGGRRDAIPPAAAPEAHASVPPAAPVPDVEAAERELERSHHDVSRWIWPSTATVEARTRTTKRPARRAEPKAA